MNSSLYAQEKAYDYVIKNARIFDGKSSRAIEGDVAITGETIAGIGTINEQDARQVIDASGLVLAPGFIDTHTHSDFNPLVYPELANKLLQGVTTEVVGNCGMSAAPNEGAQREQIHSVWAREGVEIPKTIAWNSFREYRDELETAGMNTNLASLVGHGNLRTAVMGLAPRAATPEEIKAMRDLLGRAMKEGAYGISFGLVYLPGVFATQEELVALCTEAANHSGVCAFHMRNEGSQLLDAIREAITIGEKSKARIEISHLKAAGKNNWGKIQEAFQLIEQARERGVQVEADVYPYTASFAELGVILPDDYFGREDRTAFFQDESRREEIFKTLQEHFKKRNTNWENIVIATTPGRKFRSYEGKSIKALSDQMGEAPEKFLIELLAETSFRVSAFSFSQNPDVVEQVVQKSYVTVGSDSIADGSRRPHPRAFGTFPKILKEYVREKKDLELGAAIQKMTSVAAEHFGLKSRGRIEPGYFADLVLFDPDKVSDRATYQDSKALSQGVSWVFVNGEPVVENGKFNSEKKGRFLLLNA